MKPTPNLTAVVFVGGCCSALVVSYTCQKIQHWKKRNELLSKIARKQKERQSQFDRLLKSHPLSSESVAITELSLNVLLEKLQSRELRASQVLYAYIAKAIRVTEEFNCITEFIPWAENLAKELDELPNLKGPLHGLPIAIKDDHDMEGIDSTIGFARNLYKPAERNSVPVQVLIDLGAVPFCKTNVPQALASITTDNPIFGTTYNALERSASAGGSSGGSGCIVAAGGAPLATGSDIAGSLRIPAHFHGLCSLRSTTGRLSGRGLPKNMSHVITIQVVTGFITKDAQSQAQIYKTVTGTGESLQNKYDPTAVPLPWNETLFSSTKPLKIGYYTSLPIFPAFGDTPSTVLKAKSCLETMKQYQVVQFPIPDTFDLSRSIFGLYWADLGKNLLKEFDGEPLSKSGTGLVGHANMPEWMRKLLAWSFSVKVLPHHSKRMKELLEVGIGCQTLEQFTDCVNHLKEVRDEIIRRMEKENIDLLLGPVMPFPSIEERVTNLFAMTSIYTFLWNGLDMPAGVVRFGKESGKLIDQTDTENDSFLEMAKKAVPAAIGLPINVQVIGKPFQEELVLRLLCELEDCYNKQSQELSNKLLNGASNNSNGISSS
ncbi:unnamed protein product [Orchesella dallaii]|uniref:Amidase domain-containing protein n=1 Tax=Orchesella dallaii TaxID=48710 RepID=A0ABP1QRT7_9HEXA